MAKLIEDVIPEKLSQIDSKWFLSVKDEFSNLPFLDSEGCVSYYEELSSTESYWDDLDQVERIEEVQKIIDLDFYFPSFISNRFKIYHTLDYIFEIGLEDIDKFPTFKDQVRTISGSAVINELYEEIVLIGDEVQPVNKESFLNQVFGALDIEINLLKESFFDQVYHDSLDSLNNWLQNRITLRYKIDLEVGSFFIKDSDSKLNLELNQSQLAALAFIFEKAEFIKRSDKKKLLKIFSDEFRVKDGSTYRDLSIGQIVNQSSKVSGTSNESSGFKEIVNRINGLFSSVKSKK
jgi:hypothetical protein